MNNLELLLKDMSYNSSFRFLEEGKDKNKLENIAKKRGIVLPAYDLAIFECVYAYTDRQNKNGCTLPKEEVEKALPTLVGKSIDIDHFRHNVVGHWLGAELKGDEIIAYGAIFKGSFKDDFTVIKELFDKGNLSVSFEAWGKRTPDEKEGYVLSEIEFAGGALLIKTQPAFEGADVLEMAREKVLEFAKVMIEPKEFFHSSDKENPKQTKELEMKDQLEKHKGNLEESRYFAYDNAPIFQALSEVECMNCKEKGFADIMAIDYAKNKCKIKCLNCSSEMECELTPPSTLTKRGRKIKKMTDMASPSKANIDEVVNYLNESDLDTECLSAFVEDYLLPYPKLDFANRYDMKDDDFAIVRNVENKKLRIFPIHDLAHTLHAQQMLNLAHVQQLLEKLSISKDNVERKLSRRIITIAMDELLKKYQKTTVQEVIQEIAKVAISRELSKEELEKAMSLMDVKNGKTTSNPTSLQTVEGTPKANQTSIQTASITEEDVKSVIAEVTKAPEKAEDKSEKVTELETKLAEMAKLLEDAQKKLEAAEKAKADELKVKQETLVKSRKEELAEFAKDMKDEDLLDDVKYEVAKLKKENAELKSKVEKGSITTTPDLTKGAEDKKPETAEEISRNKVNDYAYGRRNKKVEDKEDE